MGEEEEGGQHEDKEAAGKPGVIAEPLEERENSTKVSTGKIDEKLVSKIEISKSSENICFCYGA